TGLVCANNLRIQQVSAPAGDTAPAVGTSAATAISGNCDKPTPQDSIFHSAEGDCGETGKGGDSDTNKRKNRIDVPDASHSVTWDAINSLQYPKGAPKSRMDWSQGQLGQIVPFEGAAVSVEGYLYKVKVESSSPNATHGGESTNCHARPGRGCGLAHAADWFQPSRGPACVLAANAGRGFHNGSRRRGGGCCHYLLQACLFTNPWSSASQTQLCSTSPAIYPKREE